MAFPPKEEAAEPAGGLMAALGPASKDLGAMPPKGEEASETDMALQDAFDAIKADDVESFKIAMRTVVEACMSEYGGGAGGDMGAVIGGGDMGMK